MSIAQSKLNAALVAALSDMRNIAKDKVNPHFRSKFTSLDAILETVRPIMAKHGLAITQLPEFRDGLAGVTTRIIHNSGESTESTLLLPLKDQSCQSVGGALTYARRYSISAICGIASDEDDDGQQASTPKKEAAKISKPIFTDKMPKLHNDDLTAKLFHLMDQNKVTEKEIRQFCISKGMKDVPEFVADFSIPMVKRLIEIFADVVAFTI